MFFFEHLGLPTKYNNKTEVYKINTEVYNFYALFLTPDKRVLNIEID